MSMNVEVVKGAKSRHGVLPGFLQTERFDPLPFPRRPERRYGGRPPPHCEAACRAVLRLRRSALGSLSQPVLSQLPALAHLDISESALDSVPGELFKLCPALRSLNLERKTGVGKCLRSGRKSIGARRTCRRGSRRRWRGQSAEARRGRRSRRRRAQEPAQSLPAPEGWRKTTKRGRVKMGMPAWQ